MCLLQTLASPSIPFSYLSTNPTQKATYNTTTLLHKKLDKKLDTNAQLIDYIYVVYYMQQK